MEENRPQQIERTWAMIAHVSTFLGYVVPLGNILAPLGVWLGMRKGSEYVAIHARDSLNFQLSVTLYIFVANVLFNESFRQAFFLVIVLYVLFGIFAAAWNAHRGKDPNYMYYIKFIRA